VSASPLIWILTTLAVVVIAALSFYAGKLLFQLKQQNQQKEQRRQQRIEDILFSVHTIAKATEQQQCDLSEASIRLCNLMDALPLIQEIDFSQRFPALYELYDKIKHMPTHDARKALKRNERMKMDLHREELESELESKILRELTEIKVLSVL